MEDFILNELAENQEEPSIPIVDEENYDGGEELLHENSEDDCPDNPIIWDDPEPDSPYENQEPYSDFFQEDRNGDGFVDAVHILEDMDGDGAIDHTTSYFDDNFDGNIDRTVELADNDKDGYFETKTIEEDTNSDGNSDIWYKGVDFNGDGNDNIVEVQQDTNHTGIVDTYSMQIDTDGDGSVDYAMRGTDYNDDGQFDSVRIYEDENANGIIDTMTEIYDSDKDGNLDRADVHHDYDEDGRDDWTQICRYDPSNGTVTPLNDPPSYAESISGTRAEELNQFEPKPDYPEGISGDPSSSMEQWEYQGNTGRCALYSQKFIVEEFTGQDIDISEFVSIAESNGWFSDDFGTTFLNTNKMLDYYGIENEMSFHNDIEDIESCLSEGGRVIVAIDANEIWYGEGDDLFSPSSGANHAVEVIGIDYSDPDHPMVILNDSGNPNGKGEMVPLDDFMDAWKDGECQMIKCYPKK